MTLYISAYDQLFFVEFRLQPLTLLVSSLPLRVKVAFNFKRMDEAELSFEREQSKIKTDSSESRTNAVLPSPSFIFSLSRWYQWNTRRVALCILSTQWIERPKRLFDVLNSEFKQKNSRIRGECVNFSWKPKYVPSN